MSFSAALEGEGIGLLAAYLPTNAQDVVAVFDTDFNQLFPDARPMKATVKEIAKLMKHPVETGATITDHRIIMPIGITLAMVCTPATYPDTYNQIKQVFLGNATVQVQTNTGLYSNMLIGKMPHDETIEHFDTIAISLELEEVQFVTAQTSALPDAPVNGGNKNGKAATTTETSAATGNVQKSTAAYSLLYGK